MTLWTAVHQASLSFIISRSLLKLISIESVMPSNHLILCCPLLPLPSNFPISKSFLMSQLFASGSQSVGASALASVLPVTIQDWFPWGLTGLISLQSKGLSPVFSKTAVQKHQFFNAQSSLWSNCHIHTGRTIALTIWTFVGKMMSLLFNMLSRFVIAFLLRSKCLLTLWLQSLSTVILKPKKIKSVTVSIVSPSVCCEVMGLDARILDFECWVLSQLFTLLIHLHQETL